MSFTNPEVFWALLVLVPAWWLLSSSYLKGKTELVKIGGAWRGHHLQAVYLLKSFFSGLSLLLALTFLVIAWAGPTWGNTPVEEPQDGLDIALCVDISRSMTATDVLPTRLEAAREAIRSLLNAFPEARFSVVAFKGEGRTLTPLTPDKTVLERWIDELRPEWSTFPGTNLQSGVEEGLRTVDFPSPRHKAILVFSDGEALEGNASAVARLAASRGIQVTTIGLGTKSGAKIPLGSEFVKDAFGFEVLSRLTPGPLQVLAVESGGKYYENADRTSMRELQDHLSLLGNPASRGGVKLEVVPQFRVFLLLGLASLAAFLLVRIVPWRGGF